MAGTCLNIKTSYSDSHHVMRLINLLLSLLMCACLSVALSLHPTDRRCVQHTQRAFWPASVHDMHLRSVGARPQPPISLRLSATYSLDILKRRRSRNRMLI